MDTKKKAYISTRSLWLEKGKHEKTKKRGKNKKKRLNKQRKKELREGSFPPQKKILVGNYGLRKAERWDDMPSMSSEVGGI